MGKVHFHCIYVYNANGNDVTAKYKSTKHSHNIADPSIIMNVLTNEIKKVTGRTVKGFMLIGKEPVKTTV